MCTQVENRVVDVDQQVCGPDNEVSSVQVPPDYDGGPVMIWNDGHATKIFIGSQSIKDDLAAAAKINFSQPAGVEQVCTNSELCDPRLVQPQLAPHLFGLEPGVARSAVVHPSPAHLSLSCHALVLAAAQGIKKGDFENFNSDAVANANAVTPVGGVLLKKYLWPCDRPDSMLMPSLPHSSSSLLTERDEDSLNVPSISNDGHALLTDRAFEPGVRSMLVNNYIMSPRRVGATAGARARHESMIRALNPGEFFTFEEFQSDGQSGWTCLESFLHQSPSVPHSPWRVQMDARSRTSVLFHVSPLLVEVPDSRIAYGGASQSSQTSSQTIITCTSNQTTLPSPKVSEIW